MYYVFLSYWVSHGALYCDEKIHFNMDLKYLCAPFLYLPENKGHKLEQNIRLHKATFNRSYVWAFRGQYTQRYNFGKSIPPSNRLRWQIFDQHGFPRGPRAIHLWSTISRSGILGLVVISWPITFHVSILNLPVHTFNDAILSLNRKRSLPTYQCNLNKKNIFLQ